MPETNVSEEFRKRQDARPDQWTLAWWREQFAELAQGYRGATHGVNCALAQFGETHDFVKELLKRCETLEREHETDRAKIGQMQAEHGELMRKIQELEAWKDRVAKFLNTLKNGQKVPP